MHTRGHGRRTRTAQAVLSRQRLACLNRARERRKLRVYLCEWAPLQDLVDGLDMQLQHAGYLEAGVAPFGMWVLAETLSTMCRFLLLGFELELYAPCEFQALTFALRPHTWTSTSTSANVCVR